jgi:hypothetical protein
MTDKTLTDDDITTTEVGDPIAESLNPTAVDTDGTDGGDSDGTDGGDSDGTDGGDSDGTDGDGTDGDGTDA